MTEDIRPRIRGLNPPPENIKAAERHTRELQTVNVSEYFLMAVAALVGITLALAGSVMGLFIIALPIGFAYLWLNGRRKQLDQLSHITNLPIPLHAYNTEFTLVLADNSTLKTNVHFQIPSTQTQYMEQLNRVTEKQLLIFCATRTTPPGADEINDYLARSLVQFQDENFILVLRAEVSLHIHIPSPKPKGGGTVSV